MLRYDILLCNTFQQERRVYLTQVFSWCANLPTEDLDPGSKSVFLSRAVKNAKIFFKGSFVGHSNLDSPNWKKYGYLET